MLVVILINVLTAVVWLFYITLIMVLVAVDAKIICIWLVKIPSFANLVMLPAKPVLNLVTLIVILASLTWSEMA